MAKRPATRTIDSTFFRHAKPFFLLSSENRAVCTVSVIVSLLPDRELNRSIDTRGVGMRTRCPTMNFADFVLLE